MARRRPPTREVEISSVTGRLLDGLASAIRPVQEEINRVAAQIQANPSETLQSLVGVDQASHWVGGTIPIPFYEPLNPLTEGFGFIVSPRNFHALRNVFEREGIRPEPMNGEGDFIAYRFIIDRHRQTPTLRGMVASLEAWRADYRESYRRYTRMLRSVEMTAPQRQAWEELREKVGKKFKLTFSPQCQVWASAYLQLIRAEEQPLSERDGTLEVVLANLGRLTRENRPYEEMRVRVIHSPYADDEVMHIEPPSEAGHQRPERYSIQDAGLRSGQDIGEVIERGTWSLIRNEHRPVADPGGHNSEFDSEFLRRYSSNGDMNFRMDRGRRWSGGQANVQAVSRTAMANMYPETQTDVIVSYDPQPGVVVGVGFERGPGLELKEMPMIVTNGKVKAILKSKAGWVKTVEIDSVSGEVGPMIIIAEQVQEAARMGELQRPASVTTRSQRYKVVKKQVTEDHEKQSREVTVWAREE